MQRAICRVFRGQCRKFRENDCPPVAAGEEVRHKNNDDTKNGFVPPKHTLEEAATWTSALLLGYQLTHRRRLIEECPPASSTGCTSVSTSTLTPSPGPDSPEKPSCPFSLASKVFSQPFFSQPSTVLNVCRRKSSASTAITSIDVTPFIHDDAQDSQLPDFLNTPKTVVEDDDIVFAFESDSVLDPSNKQSLDGGDFDKIDDPAEYGRKFGADLLSVLGAFEFLQAESKAKSGPSKKTVNTSTSNKKLTKSNSFSRKHPPIHALDLLKRGADLGSARAVYNIGVAYDRLNDPALAREYYKRAADLGHPLATYNCAVFALRDGHLTEGYALMRTASDFGVPEAEEFMKPSGGKSLALPIEVAKV